jgi:hypothetical protein
MISRGPLFLTLTTLLALTMILFIAFQENRQTSPSGAVPTLPQHQLECGYDIGCFIQAVSGCKPATFLLSNPGNDSLTLRGELLGQVIGKCQVVLEDSSGKSMTCYLDRDLPLTSIDSLLSVCSGELLEELI